MKRKITSKTKRILSLLCAVVLVATTFLGHWYTKQAEAADDVEPVMLDGFDNLTISDFVGDSSRTQGTTLTANTYEAPNYYGYAASGLTNFDKKLVSLRVTFEGGTYKNSIMFGGNSTWVGFNLYPSEDGSQLVVGKTWASGITSSTLPTLSATTAGVDSFINKELLLQMSFEYGEAVDGIADLTLGIYINGELYNNEKFTIADCSMSTSGARLAIYPQTTGQNIIIGEEIEVPVEPVTLDGFDNLTISDFVDSSGNEMAEGEYAAGAIYAYSASGLTNFDKKLISVNVTFKGGTYTHSILVGGTKAWSGFNIYPSTDGTQLVVGKTWGSGITSSTLPTLSAETAGVDSFINDEFLLQLSFEYEEEVEGIVDLKLGIYIDGELYNNEVFTIASCDTSALGNYMAVYCAGGSQGIIIGKEVEFPIVPVEPVDPFEGYEEVTIKDFIDASGNVMEEKAYTRPGTSAMRDAFTLANHSSFDEKVLSMNVKFKAGGYQTKLHVAGSNNYYGLWVYPNNDTGSQLWIIANPNYTGVSAKQDIVIEAEDIENFTSFVNTEFLLQLAFNFGEVDAETNKVNLLLDVYINGTLCGSKTFEGCDMTYFGNRMELYREADESTIIVGSVNEEFPEDPGIQPSARYEKLTFGDFAIVDGTYSFQSGSYAVIDPNASAKVRAFGTAADRTNLDKTVICGDIFLQGATANNFRIVWGGQEDSSYGWDGLRMSSQTDGTMKLEWRENYAVYQNIATLDPKIAGVTFVGEEYSIMLSSELVDSDGNGDTNDLKIGIWFNEVLYNQQYFYATDVSNMFGNIFGVACGTDGDTATLGSVRELLTQPSEDLKKITYSHFGIADGEYTSVKGALNEDTVAGTVLCGDIQLAITDSTQYCQIVLGDDDLSDTAWNGIRLLTNDATKFNVRWYDSENPGGIPVVTVEAIKAGVDDFNGEKFNLMISTEIIDNDSEGTANDIKLGIWINGFLYQNQYFIIEDKGTLLKNGFIVSAETAWLNSDPELSTFPNKDFDKVTFSDFGLESQVHTAAEGMLQSNASDYKVLDKVVFSGDFRLSDSGNYHHIIYGGNGVWNGLKLLLSTNGNAQLGWHQYIDGEEQTQSLGTITPEDAGLTSFTKETFNLKISTELVDNDGNGIQDIKVGIWFNDILCPINGNEYSIITDWGDYLGNRLNISLATGTNIALRNDADYQSNPYYYEDISSYRQDTGYTYPTLEGYVFAGWYADEAYTEYIGTDVTSGIAWAKFVEEDVLSAKPQIMIDSTTGEAPTDSTSLRFATTVDSLVYRKISFYLQKQNGNEVDAADLSNEDGRKVYEKLYYIGSNTEVMDYKPSVFSWQSKYFKTFTLTNIPSSDYGVMIKATPFWVTMDGTEVRGKTLETCVDNYEKMGTNTSTAVSIDFLGEDVMPITGYFGPYKISESTDSLLIPDYNTDTYFKMIADSGVKLMVYNSVDYASNPDLVKKQLELGEKYGIGIYVYDSSIYNMSESDMLAQIAKYSNYKAFCGMYLVDEPGTSNYCSTANNGVVSDYSNVATILNNNNISYYGNMFPVLDVESKWWEGFLGSQGINDTDKSAYITYIDDYYTALNPSVISYDYYPFSDTRKNDDGSYNLSLYFWNIDAIRDKARATGKPFWTFVQAGSQWNDSSSYFESNTPYYPTEGEFYWNANTALAFGSQGIQYFPLIQPKHFAYAGTSADDKMWDFSRNGLIGAFGNKTQWYDYAQSLNKHIAAIDGVLMNSYSKQIIAIGSAQSDTSGLTDVTTTASYNNVLTNATGNALIGCFDYCGKTALYVVNYDYANAGDVTLTLNGTKNITKIENAETTETSASSLILNMEAGEGILLVIE